MSFTGKATYSAGASLPELVEDIGDVVGIVSPFETPLLDHLGDPQRAANSTVHQWLEDQLLPNTDVIDDDLIVSPTTENGFDVANPDRFRVGDQVQVIGASEVMFVTAIVGNKLSVMRGYGGSPLHSIADAQALRILGNAALEGDDAPNARFTNRVRQNNVTQIFTAGVEVSGSQLAAKQAAIADELDYQYAVQGLVVLHLPPLPPPTRALPPLRFVHTRFGAVYFPPVPLLRLVHTRSGAVYWPPWRNYRRPHTWQPHPSSRVQTAPAHGRPPATHPSPHG